ncbi:MAG: RNA polymerase factor sigma-54 [Chlamydiia bacterium]|nr:RNA polymerase factor sigma-54 [Chlamydiia bacterium]
MHKSPQFNLSIQQDQRLIMSAAMQRAFHVLQLPVEELSHWLEQEIQQNPVLNLPASSANDFDTSLIPYRLTLYEHLISEINLHFSTEQEKRIARHFAGSLDHNGHLTLSPEELNGHESILHRFQRMEPLGIGARSAQEALLIQLEGKEASPLYTMIAHHYQDLLHLRLSKLAKKIHLPLKEVKSLIHNELRMLNPFPGRGFDDAINPSLTADILLIQEEDSWRVEVNDSFLPSVEIHASYLQALEETKLKQDEVTFIRRHLASGKWLIRILERRKKILQEIATYLLKQQRDFFEGIAQAPTPLTMKEVAQALSLSESTMTRAIVNKSLASPRGLQTFRSFFSRGLPAKDLLLKLIDQETEPLSDEALSKLLEAQGLPCARRTVTKYRKELKIGSASQRKMKKP